MRGLEQRDWWHQAAIPCRRSYSPAPITLGIYVTLVLGASTIYQVAVTFAMWRLAVQTAELTGAETLDSVRAAGAPDSALGEGLVDALGVGGI